MKYPSILLNVFLGFILLLGLFMFIQKVPAPHENNLTQLQGRVSQVSSPCCLDVEILLDGVDQRFYINRGVEQGIEVEQWDELLAGKQVQVTYIASYKLMGKDLAPVAELRLDEDLLFSRLEP